MTAKMTANDSRTPSGPRIAGLALTALIAIFPTVVLLHNRAAVLPVTAIGLIGLWQAIRARDFAIGLPRPVIVALVLGLLWAAVSVVWAFDATLPLPRTLQLLGLAALGALAIRAIRGIPAEKVLALALAGVAVGCLVALGEIATGYHLMGLLHRTNPALPLPDQFSGHFKAGTTVVALWGGVAMWSGIGRRLWLRSLVVFALVAALAKVSGSFAALLAIAAGTAAGLAALLLPRLIPALVGLVAVAAVLAAPVAVFMPDTLYLATRFPHLPNSSLHRTMIWHFAATRAMERPLLGWGMDASRVVPGGEEDEIVYLHGAPGEPPHPQGQQRMPLHPHNFALQVWLELGAVGAALTAALLGAVAAAAAGRRPGAVRAGAVATFVGAVAVAAVGYGAWQAWWVASLWGTTALAASLLARKGDAE